MAKDTRNGNSRTPAFFNGKIDGAWNKQIEGIREAGDWLIQAKDELPHGKFYPMIEGELPGCKKLTFGTGTADMLMAIARHPVLSNPKFSRDLPPIWYGLYLLTKLPDADLEAMIEDGRIFPEMKTKEIKALIATFDYKPSELAQAICVFIKFNKKFPDTSELEAGVFAQMDEGDHTCSHEDAAAGMQMGLDLVSKYPAYKQKQEEERAAYESEEKESEIDESDEAEADEAESGDDDPPPKKKPRDDDDDPPPKRMPRKK